MLTLTPDQDNAVSHIRDWYQNDGSTLTLGGYAGTGKTTLLGQLPEYVDAESIIYVSYTGKAVSVLRGKLPPGSEVSTIHRLLYHPRKEMLCTESGGPINVYTLQCEAHDPAYNDFDPEEDHGSPCTGKQHLNWSPIDNPLRGYDLVVVDEASMVSEKLWTDLTRWGVPVLAVGDHGQLPPIKSDFSLMANPTIRLEKILRQAEGSPIIQMATQARLEGRIRPGDYGDGCKKVPMHQRFRIPMKPADGDLVIVGYNRTRNELNDYYRRKNGYAGLPQQGDTVICLRNNYEAGVFNGLRGTVVSYEPTADERYSAAFAEIRMMDDDYVFSGEVAGEQFGKPKTMQEIPRSLGLFDFGYAMTCHKAQGSQADRVMVVEERMPRATDELHARWLYTAVTRAAKEVIVVGH